MIRSLLLASAAFSFALCQAAEKPKTLAIGSDAPGFKLPGIDGKTHAMSDYSDSKLLCLIFTCNHCPDAVAAATRMEQIHQDYKDKGVAVIAISSSSPAGLRLDEMGFSVYGDTFEEMKPFAEDNGWTFPYLYDGEVQETSLSHGAQATPHAFVFGPQRKLRYTGRLDDSRRNPGPVEKSYLRDALDAVLADKEPATATTRAFGCSTKWKDKASLVTKANQAWADRPVSFGEMDLELAKKLRANASGNLRLINFWSTTCSPCIAEFPDLVDTYRRFQTRNFDFISISLDPESAAPAAKKLLEKFDAATSKRTLPSLEKDGLTETNFRFSGSNPDDLAEAIDPEWNGALPYSVLISPAGEIVWQHGGRIDPVELRRQILKGLEVAE